MWRSNLRPYLRVIASQVIPSSRTIYRARLSGQVSSVSGTPTAAVLPKIVGVREATDTLDLIDQLLWALGPADSGEPGFVFFDLDETLITRDTCLIDGLGSTRALIARLEAKLGPSSETLRIIRHEMERDYYGAEAMLVDPLLARVIRALKVQGHSVFGLTSNALDTVHAPQILEALAKYKIRFSAPDIRGELPRSGALMCDHPICRGVIFADNQQAVSHDKGEIIAEYVGLLLHNARRSDIAEHNDGESGSNQESGVAAVGNGDGMADNSSGDGDGSVGSVGSGDSRRHISNVESSGGSSGDSSGSSSSSESRKTTLVGALPTQRPRKCVLVDNTSKKCEKAAATFARHAAAAGGGLELHAIHFTEAENLVDSPDALRQLRVILGRLKARGLIGVDLVAEDILATQADGVRRRRDGAKSNVSAPTLPAFEPDGKGARGGHGIGARYKRI